MSSFSIRSGHGYEGARWPADEYYVALVELARKELGWSEERLALVRALW